jgi:RHS repeat-associated protein
VTGGPSTAYTYYPDGSLNTIAWSPVTGVFKYAYTSSGQYQTVTFPNGQTRDYTHDDQSRLTQIANVHPTAGNLATYAYAYDVTHATGAYDRLGHRTSMTATVPSQGFAAAVHQYFYDTSSQLTQVQYPNAGGFNGEVHAWTYDAIGNRLTSTVNGTPTSYTYQKIGTNPNNWQRLLNAGATSYTYDANGNTLTRGGGTYTWDAENRLTGISGSVTASYRYDYQGRRISKTVRGLTTTYLYNGLDLIAETNTTGTTTYVFGPAVDEPLATHQYNNIYYFSADGLGSVARVTDTTGTTGNDQIYDAWGELRARVGAVNQSFGYTAREFEEGGLWLYRARYYDAATGRFVSEDPLRFTAGTNFERYVSNNPSNRVDPTGLIDRDWCTRAPDTYLPGPNFADACRNHDRCFDTCRIPRRTCDRQFCRDLETACSQAPFLSRFGCRRLASLKCSVVSNVPPHHYYEPAQARACGCRTAS